jgi:hypothetical protein
MSGFPPAFYAVFCVIDRFSDVTGKLISLSMLWLDGLGEDVDEPGPEK